MNLSDIANFQSEARYLNPRLHKSLVFSVSRHPAKRRTSEYVGGLADRLKGAVTAFLLAVATDRTFIIDWQTPYPIESTFSPNSWDWTPQYWQGNFMSSMAVRHVDIIDSIDKYQDFTSDQIEKDLFCEEGIVYLNCNMYSTQLVERLFSAKSSDLFHAAVTKMFRYRVPHQLQDFQNRINEVRLSHDCLVGVHLRTGNDNDWSDPSLACWEDYQVVLRLAVAKAAELGYKNPLYYFASDSERAKAAAVSNFRDGDLVVGNGRIGHIDRTVDISRDSYDYAAYEFFLLSQCDFVVGTMGDYWRTAALFGGKPWYSW